MFLCLHAQAQYKGGNGDGTTIKFITQLNPLTNIYKGTNDDGFGRATLLNRNPLPNVYAGKYGDGFGYLFAEQLNYQPNIYTGGNGYGNSYTAIAGENQFINIYAGGDGTGFATVYVLNENNSINIYGGGDGDGTAADKLFSINPFSEIYGGGNSDGFATIVIYQANPVGFAPLELKGEWQHEDIALQWTGKREDGYRYELERSTDEAGHFVKIADLDAASVGIKQTGLGYTDKNTRNAETFYYRVQRFGKDGKAEPSAIIKFSRSAKAVTYTIYPNPGQGIFNISIKGEKDLSAYSFKVLNGNGSVLLRDNISSSVTQFNITQLTSGAYYVQLFKSGKLQNTYKILLQH